MKYIAMCSCGKDSLAMVLKLLETNQPLDEVLFYDTGMEFQAIYKIWDKLSVVLKEHNIKSTVLTPSVPFETKAFDILVRERGGGTHQGYSWCGGRCRWGTAEKLKAMDNYCENKRAIAYIGIAADEAKRISKPRKSYKRLPLVEWGMSEKDCLEFCWKNDWNWEEGGVDLYNLLDRVSCWCCRNKNKKELRNIYKFLPEYWEKLKEFQRKTTIPMKARPYKKAGKEYGTVFEIEKMFKSEAEEIADMEVQRD